MFGSSSSNTIVDELSSALVGGNQETVVAASNVGYNLKWKWSKHGKEYRQGMVTEETRKSAVEVWQGRMTRRICKEEKLDRVTRQIGKEEAQGKTQGRETWKSKIRL